MHYAKYAKAPGWTVDDMLGVLASKFEQEFLSGSNALNFFSEKKAQIARRLDLVLKK